MMQAGLSIEKQIHCHSTTSSCDVTLLVQVFICWFDPCIEFFGAHFSFTFYFYDKNLIFHFVSPHHVSMEHNLSPHKYVQETRSSTNCSQDFYVTDCLRQNNFEVSSK